MTTNVETQDRASTTDSAAIDRRYLLVSHIPLHRTGDGRLLADELWQKDLIEHLGYIPHFHLASPLTRGEPPTSHLPLPELAAGKFEHVELTLPRSRSRALLGLPRDVGRLWRAIGRAEIVHVGVVGWPFSPGWIASPLARLRGRMLVVVIESAPWRLMPDEANGAGMIRRLRAAIWERLAKWCVRSADISFFTQAAYRDTLLGKGDGRGHVLPASWIDESVILDDMTAEETWRIRQSKPDDGLALAFVGRLTSAKGVITLLDAIRKLDGSDVRVTLDIFGTGELEGECIRVAGGFHGNATIRMRGTLAYGEEFFRALRPYQAILVPSLGDEQPRIIFDAFSQALPILGSDTPGIRQCVSGELEGRLFPPGDSAALAGEIIRAAASPVELRGMGLAGLKSARRLTHREMHRVRCRIIREALKS